MLVVTASTARQAAIVTDVIRLATRSQAAVTVRPAGRDTSVTRVSLTDVTIHPISPATLS